MNVEVPGPGGFEAAFGAALRRELDAIPAAPLDSWPAIRRVRPFAFASAATVAVIAALVLGAVAAFAYGPPGAWVQTAVGSFHRGPQHGPGIVSPSPTPRAEPSESAEPSERAEPSPTSTEREHESPEPTSRSSESESPEPRPTGGSPPPDQ